MSSGGSNSGPRAVHKVNTLLTKMSLQPWTMYLNNYHSMVTALHWLNLCIFKRRTSVTSINICHCGSHKHSQSGSFWCGSVPDRPVVTIGVKVPGHEANKQTSPDWGYSARVYRASVLSCFSSLCVCDHVYERVFVCACGWEWIFVHVHVCEYACVCLCVCEFEYACICVWV